MTRRVGVSLLVAAAVCGAAGLGYYLTTPPPPPEPAIDDSARLETEAREAFMRNPSDGMAALRLARAYRLRQKYSDAQFALGQAGRLGVSENEGRKEAVLLLATGDWPPQMEGMFQRVVKDNPADAEVLLAVGKSYAAKDRTVEAERVLTQLVNLDPTREAWRYERGAARMAAADYGPAADDLRFVVEKDPANYRARLLLANSLLGDARMAEAEKHLIACRDARPDDAGPLIGLAKCAAEKNDPAATERLLRQAVVADPSSVLALQELAAVYVNRQQNDEAIGLLKKLLTLDPDHRSAHLMLSQTLLAVGRKDESREHERRYQELDRREEARLLNRRGMR